MVEDPAPGAGSASAKSPAPAATPTLRESPTLVQTYAPGSSPAAAAKNGPAWLRGLRLRRFRPTVTSAGLGEAVGRGFARLTVAPAIVIAAWLLPGLPLLLAGEFLPVPMLLLGAPLATTLAVNVLHRVPGRWPTVLPGPERERAWMSWWAMIGTAVVAVAFIAWQLKQSSPSVIATRTPGAYFQTGYWIAQHGSLPITQSLAAFGGAHPGLHFSSIGFFQDGHAIVPAVTAGLPMLLAGGFWTSGMGGGAVIGPVLGGLALLSFGGLVGRLAGRQWAPAGALVLALTLPELYTSRDSFGEPAIQLLLFGGLCLLADALTLSRGAGAGQVPAPAAVSASGPRESVNAGGRRRVIPRLRTITWRSVISTVAGWPRRVVARLKTMTWRSVVRRVAGWLTPERMLALLGGLALGLTSLVSPGALVYLLPAIGVAGVLAVARRAVGVAFCIGLSAGTGYGIAGGYLLARPLMDALAPILEVVGADAAGLAVLTIAVLWLMRSPRVRGFAGRYLARRPLRWLPGLGGAAVIAALAGLAARPYLEIVRGKLGPSEAGYIAALQRISHLRIDPTRLYSEDTLYWVIWYAGIAAVLLGGFGAAVLVRRCLRALLTWRDPSGTGLNWALPLAVLLGGSAAVLWQPFTIPDQPWASRRLVPVVIPGLILFAVWAAAWLTGRARERGAGVATAVVVSVFCVGAMLLPSVSTSFGFGLTHSGSGGGLRPSAGGLAQHRVGTGEISAVRGLCASIGRSSSVVIVDRRLAQIFTQAIRGMCGVPVAWLAPGAPATEVDAVLSGIIRAGRHPVVLGARPGQVAAFGGRPMLVLDLATTQDPHELTQPPGAPWLARYVIWLSEANLTNVGV